MKISYPAISFVLLALLFPAVTAAQNESVTVEAESLPGLWKIGFPAWSYGTLLSFTFGPVHDDFCRLAGTRDNLNLACLHVRFRVNNTAQRGAVTLSGNRMQVSWGTGMLRGGLDLRQQPSGIFTGNFVMRLAGIPVRSSDQLTASKITLSEDTMDADGKSVLLAKLLNAVAEGAPIQSLAQLREGKVPPTAEDLRPLGRLVSVIYLGRTPSSAEEAALYKDFPQSKEDAEKEKALPPSPPPRDDDASSVYAAEFEKGERLCAIYQRPDGVVEDLSCV
jgi:hypothetical protein